MEKIEIKNFGPISTAKIEIKKLNIFIGQQATGKSTIAKLIYYFKSIKNQLFNFELFTTDINKFIDKIKNDFIEKFEANLKYEFEIKYSFDNKKNISVKFKENNLDFKLNKILYSEINDFIINLNLTEEQTEKQIKLNQIFADDLEPIFIPAGRNILIQLSNQITEKINKNDLNFKQITNDVFLNEFIKNVIFLREEINLNFNKEFEDNIIKEAKKLVISILGGNYKRLDDNDVFFYDEKNYVPFTALSSGQMETIWIVLLLFTNIVLNKKNFIILEEPEANIFPDTQAKFSHLISLFLKLENSKILITTHSPFILASFNNMIYANEKSRESTKVSKIMEPSLWLDILQTSAYSLEKDIKNKYKANSIINTKIQQLKINPINSISKYLNEEYYKISEI